jgi:hypothetical protein
VPVSGIADYEHPSLGALIGAREADGAAPTAAHCVSDGRGLRARLPSGSGAKSIAATEQHHAPPIGSVPPTVDVAARKPRYYGHFSQPVLWRDVMYEKTSGKPWIF